MYIKLSDENTRFIKLNVNKLKNNEFQVFYTQLRSSIGLTHILNNHYMLIIVQTNKII
ncbi:hypothetical protein SASC598O02_006380 [Snodgrassella alvi SCGC AB-598-O02]|nr:hypothetical protein SASC598O02_006380 [Snodgrassella alvi SCGC AB-598-O02]